MKNKRDKKDKRNRSKIQEKIEEILPEPIIERKPKERDIKDYARKFYDIMKKTNGYVNGVTLLQKFDEFNWTLDGNPNILWRTWRQCEHDFPGAIEFTPQSSIFWDNKPSGWRCIGPPDFEKRKKKKLK